MKGLGLLILLVKPTKVLDFELPPFMLLLQMIEVLLQLLLLLLSLFLSQQLLVVELLRHLLAPLLCDFVFPGLELSLKALVLLLQRLYVLLSFLGLLAIRREVLVVVHRVVL